MHTAEASTPAPAYATSRHSSAPCTVPSSPYGPCSTGNATSASSKPPPGATSISVPSRVQRPSRSILTGTTSWPAAASPSATAAPERSETSCSLDRPPLSTATRNARSPSRARSRHRLRLRGWFLERPDDERHRIPLPHSRPGSGRLVDDAPVVVGIGDGLLLEDDVEAVVGQDPHRTVAEQALDVGHDHRSGAGGDEDRHLRAALDLAPGGGILGDHGPLRLIGVLGLDVGDQVDGFELVLGDLLLEPDDAGDLDRVRALGDEQRHLRPALELRPRLRLRADRQARLDLGRELLLGLDHEAATLEGLGGAAFGLAGDIGHLRRPQPGADRESHGRALLGLLAGARVLLDDLPGGASLSNSST